MSPKHWSMSVSNEEVRRQGITCTISEQIRRRRWRWLGHVLHMDHQQDPRIALTWAPEEKKSRGQPKETWRRTVEGERQKMGFATWKQSKRKQSTERETANWRKKSMALFSQRRQRIKKMPPKPPSKMLPRLCQRSGYGPG